VRRWLLFSLALAAALAALAALRPFGLSQDGAGPPLDEIDAASRARLEQLIRDAESVPVADPPSGTP